MESNAFDKSMCVVSGISPLSISEIHLSTNSRAACSVECPFLNHIDFYCTNHSVVRKAINVKAAQMRKYLRLKTDQSGTFTRTKKSSEKIVKEFITIYFYDKLNTKHRLLLQQHTLGKFEQ